MHVDKAELIKSCVKMEDYPTESLPEIVLAGRSNVGKSTFINTMLNRKNLAYTSSKPGKTQILNFFNINDKLVFVDVPGYGYAKVSKKQQEEFGIMFENYIQNRENLKLAVLLVDLRHKPTNDDLAMLEYFRYFGLKVLIIGTKLDKIKKSQQFSEIKKRKNEIGLKGETFIPYSANNQSDTKAIWDVILEYLKKD